MVISIHTVLYFKLYFYEIASYVANTIDYNLYFLVMIHKKIQRRKILNGFLSQIVTLNVL